MSEPRKYYRTTYTVEVLSEDPIPDAMSLQEVIDEATDGAFVYKCVGHAVEELTGRQCAEALVAHASDPEVFYLRADGTLLDDETSDDAGDDVVERQCDKCERDKPIRPSDQICRPCRLAQGEDD